MNGLSRNSIVLSGVALALGLCGCHDDLPGKPNPEDRPKTPAEITDFAFLFRQNCSGCHGGEGKLGPAPPLNDPMFLALVPEKVLIDVITHGRPNTPMPAFSRMQEGTLTDNQIKIVAEGIKKTWGSDMSAKVDWPPYLGKEEVDTSPEAIERGEQLFAQACALCHGDRGAGHGKGESPGAINDPALLSLFSNQALRRIIITGRSDLGMPDFASDEGRDSGFKPLSSDQIDDLVALLAHWRSQGSAGAVAAGSP